MPKRLKELTDRQQVPLCQQVLKAKAAALAAPPALTSVYVDPEDVRRATMQTQYATLSGVERAAQDKWAMKKADDFAPCPAGFPWHRYYDPLFPGYRCDGGSHFITDGIIAEGIPGLYERESKPEPTDRIPTRGERVPPGFFGPVRPTGIDTAGQFVYHHLNPITYDHKAMEEVDPAIKKVFGWDSGYFQKLRLMTA